MTNDAKYLTADQTRVVNWLATPEEHREPKTQDEMAKEIGVSTATISRWRDRLNLDNRASDEARRGLFLHLPEVYEALAERAKSGSYLHMKLFLETTGGYEAPVDDPAR